MKQDHTKKKEQQNEQCEHNKIEMQHTNKQM